MILSMILGLIVVPLTFNCLSTEDKGLISDTMKVPIESCASTNSSNPEALYEGVSKLESYSESNNYYYVAENLSSSYYHVIWVQPDSSQNDFDLGLYADSSYFEMLADSTRYVGCLDWIVVHPNMNQSYYPRVYAWLGDGEAYIGWKEGRKSISAGIPVTDSLNSSKCIEVYSIYLESSSLYNFFLSVPPDSDFDLYSYYLSPGLASGYNDYEWSSQAYLDENETKKSFRPEFSGLYAIVIVRRSGSGVFTLWMSEFTGSPEILQENIAINEFYNISEYGYYYRTGPAEQNQYQIIWMQTSGYDFDFYLCSDSQYSEVLTGSYYDLDYPRWLIFYPVATQYFYPLLFSGTNNYAYLEWVSADALLLNVTGSNYLDATNCVQLYEVNLTTLEFYTFNLQVPSTGDFDLFIYKLDPGESSTYYSWSSIPSSQIEAEGAAESIVHYKPRISGEYAILVVRRSGFGTYNLIYNQGSEINPILDNEWILLITIIVIIAVIVVAIVIYISMRTNRRPQTNMPPARAVGPRQVARTPSAEILSSTQPLSIQRGPPRGIQIRCPSCGFINSLDHHFCQKCGSML
ncbi:MAG: zinc ribbon domain-containing protein [Candidatus Helarchaeota archaeon]|nr:zinc ribbon domain-containing protein [Candidatus Helarchaeota archaeon]